MMKRATVISALRPSAQGVVIPPGPCWIIEGHTRATLFWDADDERQSIAITARDYGHYMDSGFIEASPGVPLLGEPFLGKPACHDGSQRRPGSR
ncbi:MAG: hypothetical protein ABI605_09255 [Rhizobacter sp.]